MSWVKQFASFKICTFSRVIIFLFTRLYLILTFSMLLANLNFCSNGTPNVTTRIPSCRDKASFEITTCTEKTTSFLFLQQSNVVMVLQEEHITISSGSPMHLDFGNINFCFNMWKSTLRMYPVISVLWESVRFSVLKHISCEIVPVDVSVVLSGRVFTYFDTRKSFKERVEISSVWCFKDAFLKLICCSFFWAISMGLTLYTKPALLTTS